ATEDASVSVQLPIEPNEQISGREGFGIDAPVQWWLRIDPVVGIGRGSGRRRIAENPGTGGGGVRIVDREADQGRRGPGRTYQCGDDAGGECQRDYAVRETLCHRRVLRVDW